MSFDGIWPKNGSVKIYYETKSKLAKHCEILKDMFDNLFKETNFNDVIYEYCSSINEKSTKAIFDKYRSLKIPPIVSNVFLKRTLFNRKHFNFKIKL